MGIFRKSVGEPLAVTMTGVKLGDRFVSVGVRYPKLIAALAMKAGLTGRACATDADQRRVTSGAAAIEGEGALVEVTAAPWEALPFDASSFDVALVRDVFSTLTAEERIRSAAEVLRILRGGGRVVVIEGTKRTRVAGDLLTVPLTGAGFAAVRVLAEADHMMFVEGIKRA
jgi:ubiquinone/menaquinone biosynthesis C-methylase UbiE